MSLTNYKDLGADIALSELGVSKDVKDYLMQDVVTGESAARLASNFCKEAAALLHPMGEDGIKASILLNKIASVSPEDLDPVIVDFVFEQALELRNIQKSAGALGTGAAVATSYAPSLIKGFIALAALGGAGAGASAWAAKSALQGPDEEKIAKLEAGIKEYHKLRGRVQREKENEEIERAYL